jgi:tRNA threonylcarbamoyladenosine modification (KEOPS) complex  Pcc1 subunit
VSITIYSEPRFLGTYTVNNQGEFSANVTVPMDLEEGEHTLVAEGVNQNGDSLKTSVGVSYDRTAPSIVSVSPTSGSLTVGDTLTITVVANDSSDIRNLFVRFFDVTGGGQVQRDFCGTPYFLTRTSGSGAGNQTWSKTCVVPDGVISGDYEIRPVAEDIFGNYNMAGTVMTKGNMSIVGGVSDRTAPSIVSVSPTSGSFTVGDTLTITVVANDSSDIRNMLVRFFDVTGGGQVQRDFCGTPYFLTRTSGSGAGNQTWSKTCVVPDGVISGDYEIRPVAEDTFGNYNMAGTVMTKGSFRITGD